jgi:ABC-type hemin transport system ATPase subunit
VGKATLLKCINAIHKPAGGAVLLEGRNVLRLQPAEIAISFSYVAQKSEPSRFTVFDAVLMGRMPHVRWKIGEHELKIVDAALRRLELEPLQLRYIDQLSGGELQKVAIARALVQEVYGRPASLPIFGKGFIPDPLINTVSKIMDHPGQKRLYPRCVTLYQPIAAYSSTSFHSGDQ